MIGARKYVAGTVFADSPGSVLPGDVLWVGLNSKTVCSNLVPLDAGAFAIMQSSRFADEASWRADGASSIS